MCRGRVRTTECEKPSETCRPFIKSPLRNYSDDFNHQTRRKLDSSVARPTHVSQCLAHARTECLRAALRSAVPRPKEVLFCDETGRHFHPLLHFSTKAPETEEHIAALRSFPRSSVCRRRNLNTVRFWSKKKSPGCRLVPWLGFRRSYQFVSDLSPLIIPWPLISSPNGLSWERKRLLRTLPAADPTIGSSRHARPRKSRHYLNDFMAV